MSRVNPSRYVPEYHIDRRLSRDLRHAYNDVRDAEFKRGRFSSPRVRIIHGDDRKSRRSEFCPAEDRDK
jgi:hypothetical protein